MPAPFLDLLSKVEAAAKTVVDGLNLSGLTSNTGIEDESLSLPYAVCKASSGGEEIVDTGLDRVRLDVVVASDADAHSLSAHRTRVSTIFDAFRVDDLNETLGNAVDDFGVVAVHKAGEKSEVEGRKLKNTLELDIVCCALDLVY